MGLRKVSPSPNRPNQQSKTGVLLSLVHSQIAKESGHVWTPPSVQEESLVSLARRGRISALSGAMLAILHLLTTTCRGFIQVAAPDAAISLSGKAGMERLVFGWFFDRLNKGLALREFASRSRLRGSRHHTTKEAGSGLAFQSQAES